MARGGIDVSAASPPTPDASYRACGEVDGGRGGAPVGSAVAAAPVEGPAGLVQRARKLVEGTKRVLAASLDQEQRVRIVVPSMIRIFGSVVTLLLQDDSYNPSLLPAAVKASRAYSSSIHRSLGLTPRPSSSCGTPC